jgi:hypothetical protein
MTCGFGLTHWSLVCRLKLSKSKLADHGQRKALTLQMRELEKAHHERVKAEQAEFDAAVAPSAPAPATAAKPNASASALDTTD